MACDEALGANLGGTVFTADLGGKMRALKAEVGNGSM